MADLQIQIKDIEKEIRETPYHKGTEHHVGMLRARLAKLRSRRESQRRSGGGRGFAIPKHGDATVVFVGFPSVGKSTLLNKLTNAKSATADYEFTTVTVIPGMMEYQGAQIQLLDVPGLVEGAAEGKGRGREVLSVLDAADLLLVITEIGSEDHFNRINKEIEEFGVEAPILYIVNKADKALGTRSTSNVLYISAKTGHGVKKLKQAIWDKLELVRIYLKTSPKKTDYQDPLIMREGDNFYTVLDRLGSDKARAKTHARIWGHSAKHPGQDVSLSTLVQDEMEVMFTK